MIPNTFPPPALLFPPPSPPLAHSAPASEDSPNQSSSLSLSTSSPPPHPLLFHSLPAHPFPALNLPHHPHSRPSSSLSSPSLSSSALFPQPSLLSHPLFNSHSSLPQSFPPLPPLSHNLPVWHGALDASYSSTFYDPFQIKHRRRTTPAQLGILEAQFETNSKPDVVLRKQLADKLDMTPREVQVWFQNRRAKTKKLEKKAEQEASKPTPSSEPDPPTPKPSASTTPPSSIYLSPISTQNVASAVPGPEHASLATPSLNSNSILENPSPSSAITLPHELDGDLRRHRSHSLHHHPYFLPPSSALSNHQPHIHQHLSANPSPHPFPTVTPLQHSASAPERRDSRTSTSSSLTPTNSSLAQTPTTTEFGSSDDPLLMATTSATYPDGFDLRRRSSCPADFIQSFDHFGLATQPDYAIPPLVTTTTHHTLDPLVPGSGVPPDALDKSWFHHTHSSSCDPLGSPASAGLLGDVEDWRANNDCSREGGIPRRHSLAAIRSASQNWNNVSHPINCQHDNEVYPLISGYPHAHHHKPIDGLGAGSGGGPGGSPFGRRSSTSVLLKSIEEHPPNSWAS